MRAKFMCMSVSKDAYENETVTLAPVYGKDGSANASWAKATPSGRIELTISNPKAQGHFVPGRDYFVDFFDAPEEA